MKTTIRPDPRYFSWRALGTEFNEKIYPEPQLVHKGEEVATFDFGSTVRQATIITWSSISYTGLAYGGLTAPCHNRLRQVVLIFESPAGFPSGLARENLEKCYGRGGIEFSILFTKKIYPSCRI